MRGAINGGLNMRKPNSGTGTAVRRRMQRVVRARPAKLTPHQISIISCDLHNEMQFYDSSGNEANNRVLQAVEDVLKKTRF
jgi:hypothetical protein